MLTDNKRTTQGLRMMDEVRGRDPKFKAVLLDSSLPEAAFNEALLQDCKSVIVATFNGGSTLHPALDAFVGKIVAGSAPVGLIALGNPYLLKAYPNVAGYLATYSNTPTAELAAVKALFGEIKLNGRLPVTIPGLANYGDGIQMPARSK